MCTKYLDCLLVYFTPVNCDICMRPKSITINEYTFSFHKFCLACYLIRLHNAYGVVDAEFSMYAEHCNVQSD